MSDLEIAGDSEPYREFRRAFFGVLHRDGPDVRVLDALTPSERQLAERELLDRIDDRRVGLDAMTGLAYLRSRAAIGPLRSIMRDRRDWRTVHVAIALWKIDQDEEAFRTLSRAVERQPWWGRDPARVHAAAMLRHIDRPAALPPLIGALDDRDVAVRANAKQAMRERLGLDAEADALKSGQMTVKEFRAAARAALAREGG
jgi:HEAT repeat protein